MKRIASQPAHTNQKPTKIVANSQVSGYGDAYSGGYGDSYGGETRQSANYGAASYGYGDAGYGAALYGGYGDDRYGE